MMDARDKDLARLSIQATLLTLKMLTANGRDDGEELERKAAAVVDELFQLRLTAAIRAAGGRQGAEAMLCDLPEVGPALSHGLDCLSASVTAPDRDALIWLRQNGGQLERAFNRARVAHMAGTAMKMNAVENFAELQQMAGRPSLKNFVATSEEVAIRIMAVKARGVGWRRGAA